jgi:hypothetical protein
MMLLPWPGRSDLAWFVTMAISIMSPGNRRSLRAGSAFRAPRRARRAVRIRSDQAGAVQRHYVVSEAISVFVYDADTETCWVTFTDGTTIELGDFPEIELARWLDAASIGGYFNANVRGRY